MGPSEIATKGGGGRRIAGFVRWGGLVLGAAVLVGVALLPGRGAAQQGGGALTADQQKLEKEFEDKVYPLIEKYCWSCHNDDRASGGFSFDKYAGVKDVLAHQEQFERVIMNVRSEVMPPPKMPQPTRAERDLIVQWLQRVYSSNCDLIQAGRVTIRRLNRAEYNYTIQDLLGVDLSPADAFPNDDVGYGFDNIGDVLSLSPLHLEKYLAAAREVTEAAIVLPKPTVLRADMGKLLEASSGLQGAEDGGILFFTASKLDWTVEVKHPGNYMLVLKAGEMPGGDEHAKMSVALNGKVLQVIDVKAKADQTIEYKLPLELKAGRYTVQTAFLNDFYNPSAQAGRQDRNLVLSAMALDGPEGGVMGALPESHRRIIYRTPSGDNDRTVAREVLSNFGLRAYRRPMQADELDRLMELYGKVRKAGDPFERAIQVCVQAILVNPHFLFRVELDHSAEPGSDRELGDYELASRLSYFLWSSAPDQVLLDLARGGTLGDPKVLEAQVARMLKDPKAARLGANFALQWLELKRIVEVLPDPELFGSFEEPLRKDMLAEAELFFMDVVQQNRPLTEFVQSDFTFLNKRLADHYGIPGVDHADFKRTNVKKFNRGGVFGMGAVLTVTSNPNRTSPVKRGKWVMEAILGTPPPPPPPDVGVLADDKAAITTKNIRERMDLHRADPSCSGCHKPLDAIGFTMENFDAVGRWRTQDGAFPVDASGEMPDGTKIDGVADLRGLIIKRKDDFSRAMVEKMLIYAVGRGLDASDGCLVDDVVASTKKRGNRMQDLILEIVLSDAFLKKTVVGGTERP